eukprot:6948488-Pyramimonas_sp.AAC.1
MGVFSARFGQCRREEEHIIGPRRTIGEKAKHKVECPDWDLLMELCTVQHYSIGNTFQDVPPSRLVIHTEASAQRMDEVVPQKFALLDLPLVPNAKITHVLSVASRREVALATRHFLVCCELDMEIAESRPRQRRAGKQLQ